MDLETWRDIAFAVFAVVLALFLVALLALAALSLLAVKGLNLGRRKLAEVTPRIQPVRQAAVRAEGGVSKAADTVASPFIRANGLLNAVRRGAVTLFTGRDEGP